MLEQGVNVVDVPEHIQKEPVEFIRLAQEKWESKLKLAINKLCVDYKVVLSKKVLIHICTYIITCAKRDKMVSCVCRLVQNF